MEIALLISDIFGLGGLGAVMGATAAGFSVGSAIGPTIGGLMYDATGRAIRGLYYCRSGHGNSHHYKHNNQPTTAEVN